MRHSLKGILTKVVDYIRGFIDILYVETPRYSLVIQKITIGYPNHLMKSEITYTPLGCYRPEKKFLTDLSKQDIFTKFKPQHAYMLIGIRTLENCLNLNQKDQAHIYLTFIDSCSRSLNNEK